MAYFALIWTDGNETRICEEYEGICYQVWESESDAQWNADELNKEALRRGWNSFYTVTAYNGPIYQP